MLDKKDINLENNSSNTGFIKNIFDYIVDVIVDAIIIIFIVVLIRNFLISPFQVN